MATLQEAERYSCVVLMGQGVPHDCESNRHGTYGTACGADQSLVRGDRCTWPRYRLLYSLRSAAERTEIMDLSSS